MDLNILIQACTATVCTFAGRKPLCEFEMLAYGQAYRTLKSVLRDFRVIWENSNGAGDCEE